MVRTAAIISFICLVATGCSDDKNPVREYGTTLTGAVKKAERAKAVADLVTIKAEIMRHKAANGQYPPSLQELNLRDIYPNHYTYDPETGSITLEQ